jgi:hypothetical protein
MNHKNRCKRRIFGLLAACWSLMAITLPLYAGGGKDEDLSRADKLVEEKYYDEAILILSEYAKKHPDRLDATQKRLRRIVKIRGQYNDIANELLDTIINDPANAEKILELTMKLQDLESAGNESVTAFIRRAQSLAQFSYNRKRLDDIFQRGRAMLDAQNYSGALQVYAEGLDIYQDEFFSAGYGGAVENRVNQGISGIESGIDPFADIIQTLDAASAEMVQAGRENAPVLQIDAIYNKLVPALDKLAAYQGVLYSTSRSFQEELAVLQAEDETLGDRSFLSFASRLINGPSTGASGAELSPEEGMLGAVSGYWNSLMSRLEPALAGLIDGNYERALVYLLNREFDLARSEFSDINGYVQYPLNIIDYWYQFEVNGNPPVLNLFDELVLEKKADDFLKYRSLVRAMDFFTEAADLGSRYTASSGTQSSTVQNWEAGTIGLEEARSREQAYRVYAEAFLTDADNLLAELNAGKVQFQTYQAEENGAARPRDVLTYINSAESYIVSIRGWINDDKYQSAVRIFTIENGDFEKRLVSRREEFGRGNNFIQGIPLDDDSGGVAHYPAEGIAVLTELEQAIAGDTRAGTVLASLYDNEEQAITAQWEVVNLRSRAESMLDELADLGSRGRNLLAAARTQAAQAESYRQDGDRLYREAQNALARNDFDAARDRLRLATERINASLEIQASPSLRSDWDSRLVALGSELNRLENELVVREVRNLVNNARATYFAGNFESAEELLVRAQNRWKITNVDENVEVSYWITIVRGALSLRSGRTIPATAPLYAEMSQLLSDAKKSYDEGVKFYNQNRRGEGREKFNEVRQKTQEIKLMFPLNEEAGLLELRMDQVIDPGAFNESFVRRFNDAVAGTKRRSLESFAELQNLAKINPGYSGMRAALAQAEIDMGYRPPPPDPRALARSSELTSSARRIIEANTRSQFEVAQEQLKEALVLNPNNTLAMTSIDELQTRMGGNSGVLDTDSDAQYRIAVRELQQGNTLTALAIVQRLLQNPRNRNSSQILELQRRIQSIL